MKHHLLAFSLFLALFIPGAKAQYVTIPDVFMVGWLTNNYPTAMNGNQLDTTNSFIMNETNISGIFGATNLDGIQYFSSALTLQMSNSGIDTIPAFPPNLLFIDLSDNFYLNELPSLPANLIQLNCSNNALSILPDLPPTLQLLNCSYNWSLSSLPILPATLTELACNNLPNLQGLPELPVGLVSLNCSGNTGQYCLPVLPIFLNLLYISGSAIICSPNYPISLTQTDFSNLPTCAIGGPYGCISLDTLVPLPFNPHAKRLYGLTQVDGPNHRGSIFHFTPYTKTLTVDHEFELLGKGETPKCDIVSGNNGKYYGTTTAGGNMDAGVIFSWDSITGEYLEIYHFAPIDGTDARGGMVLYNNKLYGMTRKGGVNDKGVIYEWDLTTATYTKKYDMDSINGQHPDGSLSLVGNTMYGVTFDGGIYNKGVIFEWNPISNIYTKKFDFDSIKGSNPVGKLVAFGVNRLFAMTKMGGNFDLGTIYEFNYATNVVTKKYNFNGINGQYPLGHLTLYNNIFYGVTHQGGTFQTSSPFSNFGVIFQWNPTTNAFLKRRNLGNANGSTARAPLSSLTLKGNLFYGIGSEGTFQSNIFSWNPANNAFTEKFANNFTITGPCEYNKFSPGNMSYSNLFLSGDKLLASFSAGGGEFYGTIAEYSPDENLITRTVHMRASEAAYPQSSLILAGNKLFGFSSKGGQNHEGNIFEWDINNAQFINHFDFNGYTTGIQPIGNLIFHEGKFYGAAIFGLPLIQNWSTFLSRTYSHIYSWDPATDQYNSLFAIPDGGVANWPLTLHGNKIYFPFANYSLNNLVIANLDLTTNVINTASPIISGGTSFVAYQDNQPSNQLTYYNGKFYGLSPSKWGPGGNDFFGTLYEWDTTMTTTTVNLDCAPGTTGVYPQAGMCLADSVFYGLSTGLSNYSPGSQGLFRYNPQTNVAQIVNNIGGYGTPTYCDGKLYYIVGGVAQTSIVEYDIAGDSSNYYSLPHNLGDGYPNTSWMDSLCIKDRHPGLVVVIPNIPPVLSNIPATQNVCANDTNTVTFTITDLDLDTMDFTITSSNDTLLPSSNISITNIDSIYTLTYFPTLGLSGSDTIYVVANDGYGDSVFFNFVVNISPLLTDTITVVACDSYSLNNQTYTSSGTYSQQFTNPSGCDSLITLLLTVNNSDTTDITEEACEFFTLNNQTYTASGTYTQLLTNAQGCDSTIVLNLTINAIDSIALTEVACDTFVLNSQTYTSSGNYTQVLQNSFGCDSIISLALTINNTTTSTIIESACDTFTLNNVVYTSSGNFQQILTNVAGCDSILNLELSISNSSEFNITDTACESYTFNNQTYTASGTYTQLLTNAEGCDSIITLNLTIHDNVSTSQTENACNEFTWNGQILTQSGQYVDSLTTEFGCDSISILNLTITPLSVGISQDGPILSATNTSPTASYQWVTCNPFTPIPNATSLSYAAGSSGTYAVIVTQGNCSDTSDCISVNNSAVDNHLANSIAIYPNPVVDELIVVSSIEISAVKIYDNAGKLVLSEKFLNQPINVSKMKPGIYSIQVMTSLGESTFKFVKF